MDELKANYYKHLTAINPDPTGEGVYRASLFYYNAEILPLLGEDKTIQILDVGCGFGYLVRFFIENHYLHTGGVEIDAVIFQAAQDYIGDNAEFLVCENALHFLKSHPNSFDLIILIDVIKHFSINEAFEMLEAIRASLKPGGKVIFRTPNMANILGIYSRYMDLTHRAGYTEQSFVQLLQMAGFMEVGLHLPKWDPKNPLTRKLKENEKFHRRLYDQMDRSTPKCFEKNLVTWAK
jgi:2-polyprenyl-3-methyl-5-hydroxy-6-metoxy-1,4-benzoquinol methylase